MGLFRLSYTPAASLMEASRCWSCQREQTLLIGRAESRLPAVVHKSFASSATTLRASAKEALAFHPLRSPSWSRCQQRMGLGHLLHHYLAHLTWRMLRQRCKPQLRALFGVLVIAGVHWSLRGGRPARAGDRAFLYQDTLNKRARRRHSPGSGEPLPCQGLRVRRKYSAQTSSRLNVLAFRRCR